MDLAQLYETWKAISISGGDLTWWQDFFVKFYQAFIEADRWQQYLEGTGTTLMATALVYLTLVVVMTRLLGRLERHLRRSDVR